MTVAQRTDVTLRPMRWWDIEPAHRLEQALFADPWTVPMFWSELAGVPDTRWYAVAVDADSAVVGYAGLFVAGHDADVQTVAVDASLQGSGVGALLLDALLAEAARRDCSRVTLEVRADNERAQALYASRGFASIGVRHGYYLPDVDAVVMQRRVRPATAAVDAGGAP